MQQTTPQSYHQRKAHVLAQLSSGEIDKSPKGFIDEHIADLCHWINKRPNIYTTSSCSGRITLFLHGEESKGGHWLLATHDKTTEEEVANSLLQLIPKNDAEKYNFGEFFKDGKIPETEQSNQNHQNDQIGQNHQNDAANNDLKNITYPLTKDSTVYFRFEGAIMCVETQDIETASKFIVVAHETGYRESGLTSLTSRYVVNVRGALRFDIPIMLNGKLLVSVEYIKEIIKLANDYMDQNWAKIDKFWNNLKNTNYFNSLESNNLINNIIDPKIIETTNIYSIPQSRKNIKILKDWFKHQNYTDRHLEVEILKIDHISTVFVQGSIGCDEKEGDNIKNFLQNETTFGLFTMNTPAKSVLLNYSGSNINVPSNKDGDRIKTIKFSALVNNFAANDQNNSLLTLLQQHHIDTITALNKDNAKKGIDTVVEVKELNIDELIALYDFDIMVILRETSISREVLTKFSAKGSKQPSSKGAVEKLPRH
jgi:tRNA(Phe) wybutosine-synthesizing methylase Tyw3